MIESTFMKEAINLAFQAYENDEIPIGAVIVNSNNNTIISSAFNMVESDNNPISHAEIIAIESACQLLSSKFLSNCDIYVTLEPCPMCAQAISFARLRRLYFGAYNIKGGGVDHGARIFNANSCNHIPEIYGGILEKKSTELLHKFFANKR
jgi:tRNA(adenine34) deaminase